jgi:hypothetical protein
VQMAVAADGKTVCISSILVVASSKIKDLAL